MQIQDTQTWKVLACWHEKFGLSMTPHLLCYVMQRPWSEIRAELTASYPVGTFRVVNCPDINDVAYYVDHPFPMLDTRARVYDYPDHVAYSDKRIKAYPPEQGYINSWNGEGLKELKFRSKAFTEKDTHYVPVHTPDSIIKTLREAAGICE